MFYTFVRKLLVIPFFTAVSLSVSLPPSMPFPENRSATIIQRIPISDKLESRNAIDGAQLSVKEMSDETLSKHEFRNRLDNQVRNGEKTAATNLNERHRRGILVDDNFNIPSETTGSSLKWSGGEPDTWQKDSEATPDIDGSGTRDSMDHPSSIKYSTGPNKLTSSISETADDGSGDFEGTSRKTLDRSLLGTCLNLTCEPYELVVWSAGSELVPEGGNLNLSCTVGNDTEEGTLEWYKQNVSENSLLHQSLDGRHLMYEVEGAGLHHSGIYLCLKLSLVSCCYRELSVTVYQKPNYKQHLLVVGLVVAVSALLCVALGIVFRVKRKRYEKHLKLQNTDKPISF